MRKLIIVTVLAILVLGAFPALAQTNSPADNWCFDGGPLEGRCDDPDPSVSNWMWLYGFYRAQIARGALTVNDIPEEFRVGIGDYAIVLDENGEIDTSQASEISVSIDTCEFNAKNLYVSLIFFGLPRGGDRIEISTKQGSRSIATLVPTSSTDFYMRIGDPADSITPGGSLRVYYHGVLIGYAEGLNGLRNCADITK